MTRRIASGDNWTCERATGAMKRATLTFLAGIGGILFDLGRAIQNAGDALVVWSLKRR